MGDVRLPDLKFKLWTMMRDDLVQYVPAFRDADTLLCPLCCRPLKYEQFSVEHILPQQTVKLDPVEVKEAIFKNERSGLTLLCSETLVVDGRSYANGCNGWKGRYFDGCITGMLKPGPFPRQFTDTHIIALLVVAYLGLFRQYGFRVALTVRGLILRNQFFNPRRFTKLLPPSSQVLIRGEPEQDYELDWQSYWSGPVKIHTNGRNVVAVIRNYSLSLTLSHDPTLPLARTLAYVPLKHVFRPDLRLAFK